VTVTLKVRRPAARDSLLILTFRNSGYIRLV